MIARMTLCLALLLTGLSAGFFFTYEASVTMGLALVSDVAYVESFQAINATIRNPYFATVFFGSIAATLLAIAFNWKTNPKIRHFLIIGVLLNVVCLVLTFMGNVPLNNELAIVSDLSPISATSARAAFELAWNDLNLLRTMAIIAGFALLVLGCVLSSSETKTTTLNGEV